MLLIHLFGPNHWSQRSSCGLRKWGNCILLRFWLWDSLISHFTFGTKQSSQETPLSLQPRRIAGCFFGSGVWGAGGGLQWSIRGGSKTRSDDIMGSELQQADVLSQETLHFAGNVGNLCLLRRVTDASSTSPIFSATAPGTLGDRKWLLKLLSLDEVRKHVNIYGSKRRVASEAWSPSCLYMWITVVDGCSACLWSPSSREAADLTLDCPCYRSHYSAHYIHVH